MLMKHFNNPDLGKLGGGATPQDSTTAVDIVASYKKKFIKKEKQWLVVQVL